MTDFISQNAPAGKPIGDALSRVVTDIYLSRENRARLRASPELAGDAEFVRQAYECIKRLEGYASDALK